MTSLDAVLSGAGLGLCALLALLAWRDGSALSQGRLLAALAVSVCAQTFATSPLAVVVPEPALFVARAIGVANVGLLWWFCLALLRDGFRPDRVSWAGMLALAAAPLSYLLGDLGVPVPAASMIARYGSVPPLVMVAHIVFVAVTERAGDLVAPRRRARVWLVGALLFALVVALATEELTNQELAASLRNGIVLVPGSVGMLVWLVRLSADRLVFLPEPVTVPVASGMDPHDIALHRRLQHALDADACYLQPGLTIDLLADQLRAPVHQLRSLINTGMGHRNFPALLNEHRVAHAKRLLADPERARDTVLAVALQSGFASLATFNRVFRDLEGTTPTAYRTAVLTSQLPEVRGDSVIS